MKTRLIAAALVLGATTIAAQSPSTDWPQWRGPYRDGSAPSFMPPARWPDMLTERWSVEVGAGYSSPLLVGDRVFVHARQGVDEVVIALEAATGKQIWASRYPAPYEPVNAAAPHGSGPKSTPVYGDGRLFTFGISGILSRRGMRQPAGCSGSIPRLTSVRCSPHRSRPSTMAGGSSSTSAATRRGR